MHLPTKISFKGVQDNSLLRDFILKKSSELFKTCGEPVSCQVSITSPENYPLPDKPFFVRIDMTVDPQHKLVVERSSINGRFKERIEPILKESFDSVYANLAIITGQERL